mgnify:CR=1 FL=1
MIVSVVKACLVGWIFMHLKWDKLFCTILFFIGLVLAGGTMWALLQLFSGVGSLGVTDAQDMGGVAYFAHIGGFVFGLAAIKLFANRYRDGRPEYA